VAEDHQTHNAMALVEKYAAMMVTDADASEKLMSTACNLLQEPERISLLEKNIAALARTDAAMDIVKEVYRIV
jgi:UDP-N-acetylglucosamine--N-acetylmuramyl-(pentapeptide) pyrophosphoryl-undecaprenol N-acetylglucosamine transferase